MSLAQPPEPPRTRRGIDSSKVLVTIGVLLVVIGLMTTVLYFYIFNSQQHMLTKFPGGSAKDYLSDERFTEMIVEIDYVVGFEPDSWSLNTFETKMYKYVSKSSVVVQVDDPITLQGTNDPEGLEGDYRDYYTEGDTAVVYIVYVSGEAQNGENVAGVTYSGSSIGIYKELIINNIPDTRPDYMDLRRTAEANILLHEFGHVVGLINEVGFQSAYDREDSSHPNHSEYDDSIMYYQASETDLKDFDYYDKADLKEIGEAPYPAPNLVLVYGMLILVIVGAVVGAGGAVLRSRERKRTAAFQAAAVQPIHTDQNTLNRAEYQNLCPFCGKITESVQMTGRQYCPSCNRHL
ncbi:MAG: hypothetical protein KAI64_01440 [Thermoplasmata archaeon]|nr:hypothetical protein [Thermoplasmata archaeon]